PILADPSAGPLAYDRIVAASLVLGRRLARHAAAGEAVGGMVPDSLVAALAFLWLQATGRVPAMVNRTAGIAAVLSAFRTALLSPSPPGGLKAGVPSGRFVELARLEPLAEALPGAVDIVWLEDLRARLGLGDKLYGLLASRLAHRRHRRRGIGRDDPAVILF